MPFVTSRSTVGAYAAMAKGIIVSASSGNDGPMAGTVGNGAPWIMTVGAGTLDRNFPAYAVLGDEHNFTGSSLFAGKGFAKLVPLVYLNKRESSTCVELNSSTVKGKVVLCDRGGNSRVKKGDVVKRAGGVGMILANRVTDGEELTADLHILPTVAMGSEASKKIKGYIEQHSNPTVKLRFGGGTVLNVKPAPMVTSFSSRGPGLEAPEILKPDVFGPGLNILASWPPIFSITELDDDPRKSPFSILSGTSMSCPHVSGIAALVKAAHPNWSPSAVKSAIMTTSYTKDNQKLPIKDTATSKASTPLDYGNGYVNPRNALWPGLVYDTEISDYITFVCSLNYTAPKIEGIIKLPIYTCNNTFKHLGELNYPSFSVVFGVGETEVCYNRTVTNVGPSNSKYDVTINKPPGVGVTVRPKTLHFKNAGDKVTYRVKFTRNVKTMKNVTFGSLEWKDGAHVVRSSIVCMLNP